MPIKGFPDGSGRKASARKVGDLLFDPCVGKAPWWRKGQPTPVLWLGKSHPWMEEPGRLQYMDSKSGTWLTDFTFTLSWAQAESGGRRGLWVKNQGSFAWAIWPLWWTVLYAWGTGEGLESFPEEMVCEPGIRRQGGVSLQRLGLQEAGLIEPAQRRREV